MVNVQTCHALFAGGYDIVTGYNLRFLCRLLLKLFGLFDVLIPYQHYQVLIYDTPRYLTKDTSHFVFSKACG